ncbi:glycoside hydrolase family 53 protein [Polaribacter aquimarinus]|uniref:Arabinogalactan endo-beta-1,4-galactanase n=1 Tax=Polaribacter aquimarinus TaxID=2100726 RepID=A0A2U2JC05_9FLAO|nr:glycosyl hydrolase 53 family protein [Polaribacter aquimarinus]PWG05868.1 arabinogalactan endo-1,4-beta-galactosidase [Polaribacter aquimarinus]
MKRAIKYLLLFFLIILISCKNATSVVSEEREEEEEITKPLSKPFYAAVDISYYPTIQKKGLSFYNRNGTQRNLLQILKENDVNTIRLRLWHSPKDEHASFKEVQTFSKELKRLGFKVWLTVHYSDTWADPGNQVIPKAWKNASFTILKDSVYNYTSKIMDKIEPDIIQIGNEIDPGILLPIGNIGSNKEQFIQLLEKGIAAVRNHNSTTKIMIHKADFKDSKWFFDLVKPLEYDLIGVSYYPKWHGKDLDVFENQLQFLDNNYTQDIVLAETSYPFTLGWNDHTNNVIGENSQIIYPQFPATLEGQKAYLVKIKNIVKSLKKGVGFGYWGAEWVAFNGASATNGSSWENQALFDFNLKATPALEVFKD